MDSVLIMFYERSIVRMKLLFAVSPDGCTELPIYRYGSVPFVPASLAIRIHAELTV